MSWTQRKKRRAKRGSNAHAEMRRLPKGWPWPVMVPR